MNVTCTRKIEFDSAHRIVQHESKCRHLHGHRYVIEITAMASKLDSLGRIIDFSVLKSILGSWIDKHFDHGTIAYENDIDLIDLCYRKGWKIFIMENNPTAENMAIFLFEKFNSLLSNKEIKITHIRLYETPNCWADYHGS